MARSHGVEEVGEGGGREGEDGSGGVLGVAEADGGPGESDLDAGVAVGAAGALAPLGVEAGDLDARRALAAPAALAPVGGGQVQGTHAVLLSSSTPLRQRRSDPLLHAVQG